MFSIGEFSRLAMVSSRLLRYYDALGLLRPAHVDETTGYRSYSASQLPRLNRILVLRDLGFSLEQIGAMIREGLTLEQLKGMLALRRAEVERDLEEQTNRLGELERRIADLEHDARGAERAGPQHADEDVLFRELPACTLLAARIQVPSFDDGRAFVRALLQPNALSKVPRRCLGRLIVVQHAAEFEPDALDLEIGFMLESPLPDDRSPIVSSKGPALRDVPAVENAAVCVRIGPPEQAHRHYHAIARAAEARGARLAGPNREVFLKPPTAHEPPVIEMQFPLTRS